MRRAWILIIIPLIAGAAGYLFSLNSDKKYRSSALLATGFTTNETIQIADERIDLWVAGVKFDNMIERMNSELVMSLLAYDLILHELTSESPFRALKKEVNPLAAKSKEELNTIINLFKEKHSKMEILSSYNEPEKELIELVEEYGYAGWILKKRLSINRARSTDFVEVSYISENPFLSAFIVNKLSEEYIRYDGSLKTEISNESLKFFSDLVTDKKKILDEKTSFLDKFKALNNLQGDDFTELRSSQIVDYELLRQEKLDEIRSKKLSISNIDKQINSLEVINPIPTSETNTAILQIRAKINDLNQIYISTGSKDNELLKTITSLRSQLQVETAKLTSGTNGTTKLDKETLLANRRQLELELEITNANLASLDQVVDNLKFNVSNSTSKKSAIESLSREIETSSDEYLHAVDKYNTEKNKSLLSKSSTTISQRGQPNGSPESSKTILIIGLSTMASLSLCVFVIILMEFLDQTMKTPSKFEDYTSLKLLGSISRTEINNFDLKAIFNLKNGNDDTEKFKHSLRKIRFEVEASNSKVILITSTKPNEGKTFIILSLAYSMSLINKRSLIIDTNFRNNSITKLLIARPNFQKMLQGDNDIKLLTSPTNSGDKSNNFISTTSDKNIDVIGTNSGTESPSEILAGRNFTTMLNKLRENYDYIFLEGASLNEFSDTKELISYADKVITVFSAENSLNQLDRESVNFLKSLNNTFLGAILNKTNNKEVA